MGMRSYRDRNFCDAGGLTGAIHCHCGDGRRNDIKCGQWRVCAVLVRRSGRCGGRDELCIPWWHAWYRVGEYLSDGTVSDIRSRGDHFYWDQYRWISPGHAATARFSGDGAAHDS